MSENSIPQIRTTDNPREPDPPVYTKIARLLWAGPITISATSNPHRLVVHPSGWQFHIEAGMVFAHSPVGQVYLIDGVPARTIIEALTPVVVTCADCGTNMQADLAPHIPGVDSGGYVCYDCLTYYVGRPIFLPDPVIEAEADNAT